MFQQSEGHGPGSDHRVGAHPHTMFEVRQFSMAFIAMDIVLSHQDLSPGSTPALPVCLDLQPWRSPCFRATKTHHLQQSSCEHQIHSGLLHIKQDKLPHQKGQALQDKPVLQPFNR